MPPIWNALICFFSSVFIGDFHFFVTAFSFLSYNRGYKPRWIIYCTTAIAPMIVEGADIKPAGARAPQDHVAVIIPNDQWSPSQQREEEREEDD